MNFDINFTHNDKRKLARAISIVESDLENSELILKNIQRKIGNAYRIGITGPPGAGKSTITNLLIKLIREKNKTVAVIAVDPTSPFTGGALLGDRIRMTDWSKDEGVFIRSMATRGSLGGLSKKAGDVADILDSAGYDFIIFETVGVGQSELDIAKAADTTVVVLVPESGDAVQAMKAGLMEIADIFVMNKSDRPASEQAVNALKTILSLKTHYSNSWLPPVIQTIASEEKGIENLFESIENHRNFSLTNQSFQQRRNTRTIDRIREIVENKILNKIWTDDNKEFVESSVKKITDKNLSVYEIAEKIFSKLI